MCAHWALHKKQPVSILEPTVFLQEFFDIVLGGPEELDAELLDWLRQACEFGNRS